MLHKYLAPGEESWTDLVDRVSGIMQRRGEREAIFALMAAKKFIPNSPTLISANKPGSRNLMACHVVHVGDSIDEILEAAKIAAAIFKSGGGVGLELSDLSPKGSPLSYMSEATASGPVSFIQIYDALANTILQGGLRRAAMMATLNCSHPDIDKFISCKSEDGNYRRLNISVTLDSGPDEINLKTWELICSNAYNNGEPGVVFLDHINRGNPLLDELGPITAVNACSEQPLYDFGSCTLGHVVLPNAISKLGDYEELERVTRAGVRFLDRVIDVNHYPPYGFAQVARNIRNIGLGVMGWADLLAINNIPFVCRDALSLADEIGGVIYQTADDESWQLAATDGGHRPGRRRNSFLTTIAPTGHTSRLAGVENSIYPAYEIGMKMTPDEHLNHVAAWQPHIDSAISYTISFPNDAPEGIVDRIFRGAYERGIKVMSAYRYNSREGQPCNIDGDCI